MTADSKSTSDCPSKKWARLMTWAIGLIMFGVVTIVVMRAQRLLDHDSRAVMARHEIHLIAMALRRHSEASGGSLPLSVEELCRDGFVMDGTFRGAAAKLCERPGQSALDFARTAKEDYIFRGDLDLRGSSDESRDVILVIDTASWASGLHPAIAFVDGSSSNPSWDGYLRLIAAPENAWWREHHPELCVAPEWWRSQRPNIIAPAAQ